MKVVIQRVLKASVLINSIEKREINTGLLVFIGITNSDTNEDINYITKKIINLRIFDDTVGKMNLSIKDIYGDIMIISQFTLLADTQKGNRPSYIKAAKPDISIPIYNKLIKKLNIEYPKTIITGEFGAYMKIELINDGPVTIIIEKD